MQQEPQTNICKEQCYIDSICSRCDFYDGPEDDLECAAYRILVNLVEEGVVTIADLKNAKIKEAAKREEQDITVEA